MNNKKAIFILLPCVLVLWAFIAFKIYNHVKPTEVMAKKIAYQDVELGHETEKETFNLKLNYKDPFLKIEWSDGISDKIKDPKKKKKAKIKNWSWPDMVYRGCIVNYKKEVGLLQVGIRDYLVHEGTEINGFLIRKIDPDSLQIEREGELKTIGIARKSVIENTSGIIIK